MSRGPGRPKNSDGDHTRLKILEALSDRPGMTRMQLSKALGCELGTIRFHVRQLEKRGAVHMLKKGRAWTYYRRDVPDDLHLPLAALAQRRMVSILHIISTNPGFNEAQIAERSPCSRKVIHRLVAELEEAGLVRRRPGFGLVIQPQLRQIERFVHHHSRQGMEILEQLVEGRSK